MSEVENTIVPVETGTELQPARVRTPFRVLGYLLAPLLMAGSLFALYEIVRGILAGTWSELPEALMMALVGPLVGWRIWRAARTGIDPASERKVLEEASSRAMLAAMERVEKAG